MKHQRDSESVVELLVVGANSLLYYGNDSTSDSNDSVAAERAVLLCDVRKCTFVCNGNTDFA